MRKFLRKYGNLIAGSALILNAINFAVFANTSNVTGARIVFYGACFFMAVCGLILLVNYHVTKPKV